MNKLFSMISAVAVVGALAACSQSPEDVRAVVESQGYTNVKVTGYEWFACGKDDSYSTGFDADGQNGYHVHGVVCAALFKGETVRIIRTWK